MVEPAVRGTVMAKSVPTYRMGTTPEVDPPEPRPLRQGVNDRRELRELVGWGRRRELGQRALELAGQIYDGVRGVAGFEPVDRGYRPLFICVCVAPQIGMGSREPPLDGNRVKVPG
jgi:hypothetical protein